MMPGRLCSILTTLWRWKVLPTAAIAEEFFGNQYSEAAYKYLRSLHRKRLVRRVSLEDAGGFLWALTAKGFELATKGLPALAAKGYRSEAVDHDYLCTAVQRGFWLQAVPHSVALVSEQELRCCHPEHLNRWIPRSDLHRPDGYTIVSQTGAVEVTAFEVELTQKSASEYARVSSFYSPDEVTRVVWVVNSVATAESIQERFQEFHPERAFLHQFVLTKGLLDRFWNAEVVLGVESGRRIHQLFGQADSPVLLRGERPAMLDLRRRPYSSTLYRGGSDRDFLNRVAFQAPRSVFSERALSTAPCSSIDGPRPLTLNQSK
jgi:hypothetical protein